MLESAPPGLQGIGHVGEVCLRMVREMTREIFYHGLQRRLRPGGEQQQLPGPGNARGFGHRRLFENDMRIRAADAERTDACPARPAAVFPFLEF